MGKHSKHNKIVMGQATGNPPFKNPQTFLALKLAPTIFAHGVAAWELVVPALLKHARAEYRFMLRMGKHVNSWALLAFALLVQVKEDVALGKALALSMRSARSPAAWLSSTGGTPEPRNRTIL